MKSYQFLIFMLLPLVFVSCGKEQYQLYDASNALINIYLGTSVNKEDSLVYNFALRPVVVKDSVMFVGRLAGQLSDHDRTFTLHPIAGDTFKIRRGVHYEYGNYVIKANTSQAVFPIYILRTTDFVDTTFRIKFAVVPGGELAPGVKERSDLVVLFRDKFQKPANWDVDSPTSTYRNLSVYFGSYSKVKFQFITTVTGLAPTYRVRSNGVAVPPNEIPTTEVVYYSTKVKVALSDYNAANPTNPLKDENGNVISF